MMRFCTESASFRELSGAMNSFVYKLLDSACFRILQLHYRSSLHSAIHIACLTSLKKIVSINYLPFFGNTWDSTIGPDKVCDKKCREE